MKHATQCPFRVLGLSLALDLKCGSVSLFGNLQGGHLGGCLSELCFS